MPFLNGCAAKTIMKKLFSILFAILLIVQIGVIAFANVDFIVTAQTGGSVTLVDDQPTYKTVTAVPDQGYEFAYWYYTMQDGNPNPNPSTSITETFDKYESVGRTVSAVFRKKQFTVTVNADAGGTASGSGNYDEGATVTISATPNTGYTFSHWASGESIVSYSATDSFPVLGNITYTAKFVSSPVPSTSPVPVPPSSAPVPVGEIIITYMPDSYSTPASPFQSKWYAGNVYIAGQYYSRTGYTQTGWSLTAGGPKAYDLNSTTYLTNNLILYPSWESVSVPLYLTTSIGPGGYVQLYGGGNVPSGWTGKLEPKQSYTFYLHPAAGNYVYRIAFAGWHYPVQSGNSFTVTYEMMQGKNQTLQILFADAHSHPPTGDDSQPALYAALGIASLAGLIILEVVRRKRDREEVKEDKEN